jgi:hypothetical protein
LARILTTIGGAAITQGNGVGTIVDDDATADRHAELVRWTQPLVVNALKPCALTDSISTGSVASNGSA